MTAGYEVRNGNAHYSPRSIYMCPKCVKKHAEEQFYKNVESSFKLGNVRKISSTSLWNAKPPCLFCNSPLNVQTTEDIETIE